MPTPWFIDRRKWLASMAAVGGVGALSHITRARATTSTTAVGFVYVGAINDMGYNQAHAAGARAVAALPGIEIHEMPNVPEGREAGEAFNVLVRKKHCRIVFATSYGYFMPHVLEAARKFPDTIFLHSGAVFRAGVHPANVGTYFAYIDEAQFVSGLVAGRLSRSGKLGFIAARAIPQVLRNVNAFFLGARHANPDVRLHQRFTGEWNNARKELASLNEVIADGVDVISCHVDSPVALARAAERRGIGYCGYHFDQRRAAPTQILTGAEFQWSKLYVDYVQRITSGRNWSHSVRGGLAAGLVRSAPYGSRVPSEVRTEANEMREAVRSGAQVVFSGPLNSNLGTQVIASGVRLDSKAPELEKQFWLAEGIIGELPK